MTTATVKKSVKIPMFGFGVKSAGSARAELEKERRNAAYLEELDRRHENVMRGNFNPMTLEELWAYIND